MTPFDIALTRAKVAFMGKKDAMFIHTVCAQLNLEVTDSIPTLATNGTNLMINPEFFMTNLPSTELRMAALAHETYHVVLQHISRVGSRDHEKYNRAGDYRINYDLKDAGYTIGKDWLYDPAFATMSTEEIYNLLPDEPPKGGSGAAGSDDIGSDIGKPGPGETQATVKAGIDKILIRAATASKIAGQAGSIPGDVQVYLDGLLKPKLPLAALLRRFFTDVDKSDYSWSRPNRRFQPKHYLPCMKGVTLGDITFAYDMSGSVSDKDTQRYASEVAGVMRSLKPSSLTLVQFDTEIISVHKMKTIGDMMRISLTGRGGTDVEPLMQWAKKHKPAAMVVFTDGEFYHPATDPGIPVLWLIHGSRRDRFQCKFGRVITFEV